MHSWRREKGGAFTRLQREEMTQRAEILGLGHRAEFSPEVLKDTYFLGFQKKLESVPALATQTRSFIYLLVIGGGSCLTQGCVGRGFFSQKALPTPLPLFCTPPLRNLVEGKGIPLLLLKGWDSPSLHQQNG